MTLLRRAVRLLGLLGLLGLVAAQPACRSAWASGVSTIPRSGAVVGLGDSIMHGFTAGIAGHPNAYFDLDYGSEKNTLYHTEIVTPAPALAPGIVPDLLPNTSCVRDHGNYRIVNLGADGAKVDSLAGSWGAAAPYSPATLIVAVGINDVSAGTDVTTFGNTYAAALDSYIAGNSHIVVVAVGILGATANAGVDAATPAYNTKISTACAARSANCVYADVRASWLRDDPTQIQGRYVGYAPDAVVPAGDDRHLSYPEAVLPQVAGQGRIKMWSWIREYVSLQAASPRRPPQRAAARRPTAGAWSLHVGARRGHAAQATAP